MLIGGTITEDQVAIKFRVVDCRTTLADHTEVVVVADNAEHAARLALGEDLVRGSGNAQEKKALRARVYIEGPGGLTLVRLYSRIADEEGRRSEREQRSADRWGD